MTGKQLKNAILQLAIQGKLVPQDPSDEPASALLARIRKEKEQLVKAGKLKKKDLETTPIADDEKPFEIPENWEWVRLGDCVSNRAGLAYSKGDLDKKNSDMIRVLRGGNISYGSWKKEDNDVMIAREFVSDELLLKKGTFITPAVTSLENMGKTALIDEDLYDTVVGGFVLMLQSFFYENSLLKYLLYFFCSAYYKEYCKSITNKSGQAFYNISRAKLMNLPIPLPPLAEQHRIVARVEELMPLVEEFGAAQEKLDLLNGALPEALKKSILQQAIQGKLVPQDPADEPASALLARIRKEKEQLLKAGKLKKKDLETTPISDEEKPFEIPESWEWCKLQDLCYLEDGIKSNEKGILLDAKYLRGKSSAEYIQGGKHVLKGDNIILVDGENSGEVFEVPVDGIMGSTFKQLIINSVLYKPYLLMQILFYKNLFRNSKKGAAIPHLNKEIFRNLPISLPPLAEQRRIVARVEELLAMVDGLK